MVGIIQFMYLRDDVANDRSADVGAPIAQTIIANRIRSSVYMATMCVWLKFFLKRVAENGLYENLRFHRGEQIGPNT